MPPNGKRYQVFVSSTYEDLKEERQKVISALLLLEAIPAGMELFPAADEDSWGLITDVIDDCDYYLLVIAGKYGSINSIEDMSYTEQEFVYAMNAKKPVMAFLHKDLTMLPAGKCESESGPRAQLAAFREKVKTARVVRFWESPDDLGYQIATTYSTYVKRYPAVGWIKANAATDVESLRTIEGLRKRVEELEGQLQVSALEPPPGTAELSSGDETVALNIEVSGRYKSPVGGFPTFVFAVRLGFTWDQLFSALVPYLLKEMEEGFLRDSLDGWITNKVRDMDVSRSEMKGEFNEAGIDVSSIEFIGVTAVLEAISFESVIVQFVALGLIAPSKRKRSVTDPGTYWMLTAYGQHRALQLRAIRRKGRGIADA
ncbi:DUF4062 domain-containing protein [Streptomyces sp. NBC_00988]|uniref:DUF4062 domain-containing protein n=1 Tax=Streptomyces sp. NBC_00988 TaxID=2903704 RepID=UPI00386EF3DF|nr:DUF4062 domain-containing protein [Streptomyces sp. NBC_00988]